MKEFFLYLQNFMIDPDRIPVAMLAIMLVTVVGMVTGPMHGNANPFLWKVVNGLFGGVGGRLDRTQRRASDLMFRGFVLLVLGLVFFYLMGEAGGKLAREYPFKGLTEIVLLSLSMTGGTVWFVLLRFYFAQRDNKISPGAFSSIARSTRTNLVGVDGFGLTRTGMAFAARAFDKGLVAPVFWYLLLGLPGAYIYACLAGFAWRFGKDGFTKGFGTVPLGLERLLGFIPGMFAGVLMALGGLFTPTGGMTRALKVLGRKGKGVAAYDQGGWPVTAMAFSLNVSLGGPVTDLDGSGLKRDWVGPDHATAQLENGHLRRAIYLTLMAHMLFLASLLGALFWGNLLF